MGSETGLQLGLPQLLLLRLQLVMVPELQLPKRPQGPAGGSQPIMQLSGKEGIAEEASCLRRFTAPSGQPTRVHFREEESWRMALVLGTAAADRWELQVGDWR